MKTRNALFFLSTLVISIACESQTDSEIKSIFSEDSEKRLVTFALNRDNQFYFISQERDKDAVVPMWSSYIPMKHNLYLQVDINSNFELIDNDFHYTEDIQFDSNNKMLIRNYSGIFRIEDKGYTKLLEEPINASDIDSKDIIWAGGYNTGLIKIGAHGEIIKYTDSTSLLPSNGINYIYVDYMDIVWGALWNNQGIIRIDKEDWQIYNSTNSNLTSQNIWAIHADKDNNIWIGTGHDDSSLSLMQFDGTNWQDKTPNINNNIIPGTIRKIISDNNNIYVISEQTERSAFYTNKLLSYNGEEWRKIDLFPEDELVLDAELDSYRGIIWFLTVKNKLYRLNIE